MKYKIKICIIYDVKGWAWWHRANYIKNEISSFIEVDIRSRDEYINHNNYNFILTFDPIQINNFENIPYYKKIIGCSCPKFVGATKNLIYNNECFAVFVNSLEMYLKFDNHERIFCCQNGVDTTLFRPKKNSNNNLTACWVGNSESIGNKGLDIITQSCAIEKIKLLILDRNASKDSLNILSHKDVRDKFYQKSNFYICASEWEGTPNTALEALSCGLPVISTRVGNIPELIVDGYNGFITSRNIEGITECIRKLKNADIITMSKNARKSVETKWTWSYQAKKYEFMLKKLFEMISNTKRTETINKLGLSYLNQNKLTTAENLLLRSLKLDKTSSETWKNLALVYYHMNQKKNATTCIKNALFLDPQNNEYLSIMRQIFQNKE